MIRLFVAAIVLVAVAESNNFGFGNHYGLNDYYGRSLIDRAYPYSYESRPYNYGGYEQRVSDWPVVDFYGGGYSGGYGRDLGRDFGKYPEIRSFGDNFDSRRSGSRGNVYYGSGSGSGSSSSSSSNGTATGNSTSSSSGSRGRHNNGTTNSWRHTGSGRNNATTPTNGTAPTRPQHYGGRPYEGSYDDRVYYSNGLGGYPGYSGYDSYGYSGYGYPGRGYSDLYNSGVRVVYEEPVPYGGIPGLGFGSGYRQKDNNQHNRGGYWGSFSRKPSGSSSSGSSTGSTSGGSSTGSTTTSPSNNTVAG